MTSYRQWLRQFGLACVTSTALVFLWGAALGPLRFRMLGYYVVSPGGPTPAIVYEFENHGLPGAVFASLFNLLVLLVLFLSLLRFRWWIPMVLLLVVGTPAALYAGWHMHHYPGALNEGGEEDFIPEVVGVAVAWILTIPVTILLSRYRIVIVRRNDERQSPCPRCGYELYGSTGRCPECGWVIPGFCVANRPAKKAPMPWIEAARTAWRPAFVELAEKLQAQLVPTTGQETDLILTYLRDPGVLSKVTFDQAWSNVAEAVAWVLEFNVPRDRTLPAPFVFYASCGLVALFLLGGTSAASEDAIATAMTAATCAAADPANRRLRDALIRALRSWPDAFCAAERNALPESLAAALEASCSGNQMDRPTREALASALRARLDQFDRPLEVPTSMVNGWLLDA